MKLLKCPTVTSNWYKLLANTSMDYQDKILEVVLYAAKQTQLTDSLIIKKKYLDYLCKFAAKMKQWKFSIANIITWHILTNNLLVNIGKVSLLVLFTRYMIKTRSLNFTTIFQSNYQ